MLRLASERDSLSVVNDQIGTPTNAVDLAKFLVEIIFSQKSKVESRLIVESQKSKVESQELDTVKPTTHNPQLTTQNSQPIFGIYNFSNEGQCSWYDFASAIFKKNNVSIDLKPIPSTQFPTPAKRPSFSVLDKSKIKNAFGIEIKNWQESLENTP